MLIKTLGEYTIETNITGMSIEQLGTNSEGKDFHTAVLEYATKDGQDPYVKFSLKLQENTGSDIFNTLVSKYTIEVVDVANQYASKNIFIDHVVGETEISWVYDDVNDIYTFEITDFATEITLNDFILASKAEHTAFTSALGRPVLEIKITDGVAPQPLS